MNVGEWFSLGSVVVAAGSVIFAVLAWRQARRSADAAARSADAAERSALAEERATEITDRAEEARQAPRLDFRAHGRSGQEAHVEVVLIDGPPEVTIRTSGVWIKDEPEPGLRTTLPVEDGTSHVAINGVHVVPVDLRSRSAELVVVVEVECTEVATGNPRSWTRTGSATLPAAPAKPATAPAEPPPARPRGLFRNLGD